MTNQYETLYPELKYFLAGYFHQDWKFTRDWQGKKPSFELVVHDFKKTNPPSTVKQATQELENFIKEDLTESELEDIVHDQLGSDLYVLGLKMTYKQWLQKVLDILKQP